MNAAAWVAAWTPLLLGVSLAGSVAVLASRRLSDSSFTVWALLLAAQLAAAVAGLFLSRRLWFDIEDALVRLDVTLGLNSRLISAHAGVGSWPAVRAHLRQPFRWNGRRVLAPWVFSISLLALAAWIPVTPATAMHTSPPDDPAAWKDMDSWFAGLAERSLVEKETLEAWQDRLEELRRQPAKQWYSHSSLEASDSLRQELAGALRSLGREMDRAGDALESAEAFQGAVKDEDLRSLAEDFDGALAGLEKGSLSLDKKLLAQLKSKAAFTSLSADQIAKMRELKARLREGAGFCRLATRECREDDKECLISRRAGISRGPGTLPLTLDPERSELGTKLLEGLRNDDVSRAAPGDLVGVGRSAQAVDKGAFRGPAAGGTAPLGAGGETVWRSSTTPEERKVLKRFFK